MLIDALNSVIDQSRKYKFAGVDSETLKQLYYAFLSKGDLNVISMNEVYLELCERGVFPQFLYVDFDADKEGLMSKTIAPYADENADYLARTKYRKRAVFDSIVETTHDGRNIRSRRYRVVDDQEREGTTETPDRVGQEL